MIPAGTRIWVCTTPVDMRRSFDGLAAAAQTQMAKNPETDGLFVFVNKRGNRLKAMWWDRTGYCLLYKRLEWGQFRLPAFTKGATCVAIDVRELGQILLGVGLPPKKHRMRDRVERDSLQARS